MTASTLEVALTYEHDKIRELAAPAHQPDAALPHRRHETDWFYAITAQHLTAAEDVLLPYVRRLPDGRKLVATYVANAKQLERSLRFLKARQYGDSRVLHLRPGDVWQVVDRLLDEHERLEADYGRMLGESMAGGDVGALTERLLSAQEVAPTRSHPFSPHTGMAGRMAHRAWRVADNVWDSAEGRVVPTTYHVHPKRDSVLSHYLRGAQVPRSS
ncbi:hypothetical protein Kfla_0934 [Kribbella flavida DSM 17836]|uniref:Hemerythrin-like domain-containing protein n=1 Tax=Kribbella flavida (strain DSM 17836 / JCM 10339 / NBRC 14399) TaxID=479435 RepID=D2Q041_KRIFD|nr:hypothetical protein [Kribbella flavida]ADB30039.1 hypothetical protein Kfla_0934 [Kribbella flavida DSM 17836]